MKVKDLINCLLSFNPEATLVIRDTDSDAETTEITEIKPSTHSSRMQTDTAFIEVGALK